MHRWVLWICGCGLSRKAYYNIHIKMTLSQWKGSTLTYAIISLRWHGAAGDFLESWKTSKLSWLFSYGPMIASGSKRTSIVPDIQVLLSPFLFLTSFDSAFGRSPDRNSFLTKKGRECIIRIKVFKDSRCESISPAENAADTLSLRCFRVDTKAAFSFSFGWRKAAIQSFRR